MNQHNISQNINSNYTNVDNQSYTVEWFIETTPDYNLTNNIQYIRRINSESDEFIYLTESVSNNTIQISREDEFIPFDSKNFHRVSIDTEVREIPVTEEERICCICYETKEREDISRINCGHKFCGTCIIEHISIKHVNPCCPLCREKIVCIAFQRDFYESDFFETNENSSSVSYS
jgi:hypothetical protein